PPTLTPFPYTTLFRSSSHCDTFKMYTPLESASSSSSRNQSTVGALPEPNVSSTTPFKPGDCNRLRTTCGVMPGNNFSTATCSSKDRKSTRLNSSHVKS